MPPPKFSSLVFKFVKSGLRDYKKNIKIIGFDTETLNGYCKLLCDSHNRFLYLSELDNNSLTKILNFLTFYKYRNSLNFFYNIRYDFQSFIKYLDRWELIELYKNNKVCIDFNGEVIEIGFIPKKFFTIKYKGKTYKYFDISQFFNSLSLNKASEKYLKKKKKEDIDVNELGVSKEYWKENIEKIFNYCFHDAVLTKELAEYYINLMSKLPLGIKSRNWFSNAYIAEYWLLKNCYIPSIKNFDNDLLYYAYKSYHGGRFEVVKKGYLDYCYHYDLNSAYPYEISNLVDITNGEWIKTEDYIESADYAFIKGYYYGKESNYIEPIMDYDKKGIGVFPHMTKLVYITNYEYELIKKYDLGKFEMVDGWFFISAPPLHPFFKIKELYEQRMRFKKEGNDLEYGIKIILNSIYGKFFEKHKDHITNKWITGRLFNPIYASLITSGVRKKIFEFALKDLKNIVLFATDSVVTSKKRNIKSSDKFGGWKLDAEGECVVIGSGVYKIGDNIRTRALNKLHANKVLGNKEILQKYYRYDYIEQNIDHVVTLGDIINKTELYSFNDLNTFQKETRKLYANFDTKREWERNFKNWKEVYEERIDSRPWLFV